MKVKEVEWYLAGSEPCPICIDNTYQKWTIKEAQNGTINYSHPNCECIFLPKD